MNVRYRETVAGGKTFWIFTSVVVAFVGGVTTLTLAFTRPWSNWYVVPVVACATLIALMLLLGRVSIEVRDDGISAWLGPIFRKNFARDEIERVEVEPYSWREFGGWGWKMNLRGASTFSSIGIKEGVRIYLKSGRQFFVTLRNPRAARDAWEK